MRDRSSRSCPREASLYRPARRIQAPPRQPAVPLVLPRPRPQSGPVGTEPQPQTLSKRTPPPPTQSSLARKSLPRSLRISAEITWNLRYHSPTARQGGARIVRPSDGNEGTCTGAPPLVRRLLLSSLCVTPQLREVVHRGRRDIM